MTTLSADDSFLDHYGFSHDPFAARVPGFKFFPAQRKPVLGQLHHLARYSQLLLVVTGPGGSGKTLLRQALVASSNKQSVQSVVITPQETFDSAGLLQQIAQALGVQRADFDSIMAQIIQLGPTGQEVYLLVDDAERLTGAAIETLLRLAEGSPEGRPHVFLFGENGLVPRLEALVEGEERFHVIALQPYEEDETREYLALRLEGAGAGLDCFSEDQLGRIHEQSEGWPGAINHIARNELIEAMQSSRSKKKSTGRGLPLPMKHVLALVAVLCVVVIALLMRGGNDEPVTSTTTNLPLESLPAASSPAAQEPGVSVDESQQAQPLMREPLAAAGGDESEALPEGPSLTTTPEAEVPASVSSPEHDQRTGRASIPAAPEPLSSPVQPAQPMAAEPEPERRPAPAVSPAVTAQSAGGWYASQPKTNYLVQVLGTRSESNAEAVVNKYGSGYRYFVKRHDGKPLYVVTYGSYPSRSAAVAAINSLPAALKSGKPWVRSLASVQQENAGTR